MFRYFLILSIVLLPFCLVSQNTSTYDSINTLRSLAKNYDIDLPKRFDYAKKASQLSYKTNQDSTILLSDRVLSLVYLDMDDYPNFRIINHKNLKLGKKLNDSLSIAYALHNLAWYHHYNLKVDSAYYYYYNARKTYGFIGDLKNESSVLLNMATIQQSERDFIGAEENAIQGIKLLETLPVDEYILEDLWSLNNLIALLSQRLKNFEKAIEYHNRAIDVAKKMKDSRYYYLNSVNNLGYTIEEKGDLKKALDYYKEVSSDKQLFEVDPELYVVAIGNVARIDFELDREKANTSKKILFDALRITDSIDYTIGRMGIFGFLANIHNKTARKDSALYYSKKAYELAKNSNSNVERLDALKLMASLEGGDAGIAYLNEHIKLNDSLILKERSNKNQFARINFETDEIKAENEDFARRNRWLLLLSGGLLLTALLVYIIINQRTKNKELKFVQQQQEANEEIYNLMLAQQDKVDEGRSQEKKRISEELHDGILSRLFGTRLSLDSINMVNTEEAAKTRGNYIVELKAIENEIRKVSHDLNTDFIANSGFLDIIETLIENQCKAYELTYHFDHNEVIDWDEISNKNKIHLYRIIQESLQNIYKHAKASHVEISFQLKKDVISLSIIDDGSGFEISKAKRGIGLKNINSRVDELKGKLTINSQIGTGTDILINVPI